MSHREIVDLGGDAADDHVANAMAIEDAGDCCGVELRH